MKRWDLFVTEAIYRQQKVKAARDAAKKEVAKRWGHRSGEALRKDLQRARGEARTFKQTT